jgi:dTDP-4-amino-4,6-dideoxygalactose transaminase
MTTPTTSTLALHGGAPVRPAKKPWPAWPIVDDDDRRAVDDVVRSGKWWYGEHVARFEEEFGQFQGAAHCVTCTSGTTALEVALEAMGIGQGDEVLVPPYTFVATASAVLRVGATPVFVDVNQTWCMDANGIDAALSPRTKAVIPVHFGSCVADMDRINEVAGAHGLMVLEDACHSWGSQWAGRGTGTLGHGGVFSFQMSKNLTAGEGGAIVTQDEAFADICRSITNCGRSKGAAWYHHARLGTNARLTELQAVLLRSQLRRLEGQTLLRESNGAYLTEALQQVDGIIPQPADPRMTRRAYHLYALRLDPKRFGCSRERFVQACQAEGLPISAGYPLPLYKQPLFQAVSGTIDYTQCACPVAEELCYESGCWLLQHVLLGSRDDMDDIVATLKKVRDHSGALREPRGD